MKPFFKNTNWKYVGLALAIFVVGGIISNVAMRYLLPKAI